MDDASERRYLIRLAQNRKLRIGLEHDEMPQNVRQPRGLQQAPEVFAQIIGKVLASARPGIRP